MQNRKQEIRRLFIEYVQELAGEDKLEVRVDLHKFYEDAKLTDEDDPIWIDILETIMYEFCGACMLYEHDFNHNLLFNLVDFVEWYKGDVLGIKFTLVTKDIRKQNKNWLLKYMEKQQ